jgi:hypothetical protein
MTSPPPILQGQRERAVTGAAEARQRLLELTYGFWLTGPSQVVDSGPS